MKSPSNFARLFLPLLLLAFVSAFSVAQAQDEYPSVKGWENFDFARKNIAPADLAAL